MSDPGPPEPGWWRSSDGHWYPPESAAPTVVQPAAAAPPTQYLAKLPPAQPAPDTRTYFTCIANFPNGTGYMDQCAGGMYSMSGGLTGACSNHGGELRQVYTGP